MGAPGMVEGISGAIGRTPLVLLKNLGAGLPGRIAVKLEAFSPGMSVKDRIALSMVEAAEAEGLLKPGGNIVEATSGNTGIGLAVVAAERGYRFHAVMSAGNSEERRTLLRALGARVVITPQAGGERPGMVTDEDLALVFQKAEELARDLPAWMPGQFRNEANLSAHELGTGPEVWTQSQGKVTHWVACPGTSGTFTGVARALKQRNPEIRCLAVEPEGAPVLAELPVTCTAHLLQGAGYNFIPPLWDPSLCDGFLQVSDVSAVETARLLAREEGILAGYSSGACVSAALQVARTAAPGSLIVTICPDTGLKYLSTPLYR